MLQHILETNLKNHGGIIMSSNTVVNTNVLALNSHRALKNVGALQSKSSARLSSGLRINSAADDAAGLAISEKMRAQVRGLDQASRNAQDGISLVQTAEGGITEISNMVQRVRELTVQSANDTNQSEDRAKIQTEVDQLLGEIDSMAGRVEFNKKTLLDGSQSGITLQVGANASQTIKFSIQAMNASGLGIKSINIGSGVSAAGITSQLDTLDAALGTIATQRANLGAMQNRLEYTVKSLDISSENLSASESRIRDTDMAKEMMNLTKANILNQASTSMLAQANQAPQGVLSLLR
jgi:flagellin